MVKLLICMSTFFGQPCDKHGGRSNTVLYGRPVEFADKGIAHRTWLMGAKIRITNLRTGLSEEGVVLDRGPYGMRDAEGWFNSRLPENAERAATLLEELGEEAYCGCADVVWGTAFRIGFGREGREEIRLERL